MTLCGDFALKKTPMQERIELQRNYYSLDELLLIILIRDAQFLILLKIIK